MTDTDTDDTAYSVTRSMAYHLVQAVRAEMDHDTPIERAAQVALTTLRALLTSFAEKEDDNSAIMALGCGALARQLRATYFPSTEDDETSELAGYSQ